MAKAHFLVRATVAPRTAREIRAGGTRPTTCRGHAGSSNAKRPGASGARWRRACTTPSMQFADKAACDAALGAAEFKDMIADFTRAWPEGVTRTRDIVTLVEERASP